MAGPSKNKAADADLDTIPIQKTNPLVYVGVAVVVVGLAGAGIYSFAIKGDEAPKKDIAAALHSARAAQANEKAKRKAQLKHLELAGKAWAAASEKERVAAAEAAASAAAKAEEEEKKATPHGGGKAVPKGPSGGDLDELDKLGSAVNSELNQ